MDNVHAVGFTVVLLGMVGVAGALLWGQFKQRPFEPRCETCNRRHLPECAPRYEWRLK